MHKPVPPPNFQDLFAAVTKDPEKFKDLIARVPRTGSRDRYLPWDDFRRRPTPEAISHEEMWFVVKLARMTMQRTLPLADQYGNAFTYAVPDELLRGIEAINRDASGHIAISEQVTNPTTRDRYVVSSLIEEAITSSQLEGAATTRRVAKEMIRSGRAPRTVDERMILNNYRAMTRIGELRKERLSPELIYEIHRMVTEDTLDDPTASGRCQTPEEERVSVWDGNQLLHAPPPAAVLPARIEVLCKFANDELDSEYVPPVVRAIALHFMVGYDHPFQDGNGRTARALFYWAMLNRGYWLTEFLSISRILKAAPAQYARSFLHTEQDGNDLTYFVLYQLSVIQRSIQELHSYLDRKIRDVQEVRRILAAMPGEFNHRQVVLLQHAMSNADAEYTVQSHMNSHRVVHETARQDLLELEQRGLVVKHRVGKAFVWVPQPDLPALLRKRRTKLVNR